MHLVHKSIGRPYMVFTNVPVSATINYISIQSTSEDTFLIGKYGCQITKLQSSCKQAQEDL